DYGKDTGNPGLIKIAQDAIKNAQDYPKQLVSTNDIEQVEVISGATNSYDLFKEAVNNALSQAKE
ncbi:FMN-binding protein, partial [Filifactor alocis]